ncbi:hypothetical protein E3P99_02550 [Wallemia hederae]|uniref:Cell differentiation protein rcd1 n=1 Tax=Wallemia hederae TaxID=1540922 RepID=A0A4T0FJ56_9BASI|nr:hypothetical protein E3P99_02550 [Wallemia hederae]
MNIPPCRLTTTSSARCIAAQRNANRQARRTRMILANPIPNKATDLTALSTDPFDEDHLALTSPNNININISNPATATLSSFNAVNLSRTSTPNHSHSSLPSPRNTQAHVQTGKYLLMSQPGLEEDKIYSLIIQLQQPATRETALLELSKRREAYDDLALVLWHSFGVMSALLQEIVAVYPLLSPPSLTAHASNRVCNALALLQCVASHNETRGLFLSAHIPLFLYPFLNTTSKSRPFEYLRLTSLGVIGALVKQNDNSQVINFLLSTEIIPLCLRIMETGSELSKTVAIFIVQKILLDNLGLAYICQTYERFYAVGTVLANMVNQLVETQAIIQELEKLLERVYLNHFATPPSQVSLKVIW